MMQSSRIRIKVLSKRPFQYSEQCWSIWTSFVLIAPFMVYVTSPNENATGLRGQPLNPHINHERHNFYLDFCCRWWWIGAIVLSIWLCAFSIQNFWKMWHRNPVTMSFTEPNAPVSAVPLPTLVICPEIKTYVKKLDLKSAIDSPFNLTYTK